jgi:hypothetical protein
MLPAVVEVVLLGRQHVGNGKLCFTQAIFGWLSPRKLSATREPRNARLHLDASWGQKRSRTNTDFARLNTPPSAPIVKLN